MAQSLVATASMNLGTDPELSLLLVIELVRIVPGANETVLPCRILYSLFKNMWLVHPHIKDWRVAPSFLPLMRNQQVVGIIKDTDEQAHLCQSFTDEAASFIRKNQD